MNYPGTIEIKIFYHVIYISVLTPLRPDAIQMMRLFYGPWPILLYLVLTTNTTPLIKVCLGYLVQSSYGMFLEADKLHILIPLFNVKSQGN